MLKNGLGKYFLLQNLNNKYKNMLKFYQICAAGKKNWKNKFLLKYWKNIYIIKNSNAKSYCICG